MVKASWKGVTIAESERTVIVEGNHYFPVEDVKNEFLRASEHHTVCSWKGTASYHHVVVGGTVNENAAWYYPDPRDAARQIAGRIAFWKGIEVR